MVSGALGDPYLTQGNQLLRMFQALMQPNVINLTTTVPPISPPPSNGATYIVGTGATGSWSGKDTQIAYWSTDNPTAPSGEWEFFVPHSGWMVTDTSTNPPTLYIYNGTAWVALIVSSPFSASGNGLVFGGMGLGMSFNASAAGQTSSSANQIRVVQTLIPNPITVKDIVFDIGTGGYVNLVLGFALYTMDGNTKVLEGILSRSSTITGNFKITLATPVNVPAGSYYYAYASNQNSNVGGSTSLATQGIVCINETYTRLGTAANSLGASAMPNTLGALTPASFNVWSVIFEN